MFWTRLRWQPPPLKVWGGVAAVLVCGFLLAVHQVDTALSAEDQAFVPLFLRDVPPLPTHASYDEQVAFIAAVQNAVLDIASGMTGIPKSQPRELKDLYLAKTGMCYDRSRAIEKILTSAGFETRHIFILSTHDTTGLQALFAPNTPSHAVTEVRTLHGWLVVDSNNRWLGLDKQHEPVSLHQLQLSGDSTLAATFPDEIYADGFIYIYGLYGRHGYFFSPYDPLPDVNYAQLLQNIEQ